MRSNYTAARCCPWHARRKICTGGTRLQREVVKANASVDRCQHAGHQAPNDISWRWDMFSPCVLRRAMLGIKLSRLDVARWFYMHLAVPVGQYLCGRFMVFAVHICGFCLRPCCLHDRGLLYLDWASKVPPFSARS